MARNDKETRRTVSASDLLAQQLESAKKIEGRVWGSQERPLNEGDVLVGTLTQIDTNVGEFGSSMLRFADPHGEEVVTWQRGTLKSKITARMIGTPLLIKYTGQQPPRRKGEDPMNTYDVYELTQDQLRQWQNVDELPF